MRLFRRPDFFAACVASLTERPFQAAQHRSRIKHRSEEDDHEDQPVPQPLRHRSFAAAIVTTVLVGTLVEAFEPAQLLQFNRNANGDLIVALGRRTPAGPSQA